MLRLHPILPFLLMLLSFLLSHLSYSQSEAAAASSDSAYQRCSQPYKYKCGTNDYNISYPFTVDGQEDGCGHPDYPLKCSGDGDNENLTIKIRDENFNVLSIDYTAEVLTIAEQDIEVDPSTCSVKNHDGNTSIDMARFEFASTDTNLTLFNCSTSSPPSSPSSLFNLSCAAISPWLWYFAVGPLETELGAWVAGCNKTILVIKGPPVNEPLNLSSPELLQQALLKGFDIKWKAGNDWCRQCLNSGGTCGYNKSNVLEPACYCSDGTTGAGYCKKDKGGMKSLIKISIGLAGGFFVVVCLLFSCICKYSTRFKNVFGVVNEDKTIEAFLAMHGPLALTRYQYSTIKKITSSFTEKLGEGGYGSVFKGKLVDGSIVAVKMLNDIKGTGEEFINEVASIGRTNHVNIVSLLGFCSEGTRRALIYEYMPNGSLEKHLFCKNLNITPLGWEQLYIIALGIAKGLEYLHNGCNTRIVHFDIKPHNILLNEDFFPKISDFGLAKLCPPKESVLSMVCARGTIGYIAPEVFSRIFGVVTSKADVYSYGMMVLEMVGGRKNSDQQVDNTSEAYFPHWIYDHLDKINELKIDGISYKMEEVAKKMVLVALWCIQANPSHRPSISKVVEMLEGTIDDLQMPPKQYICSPRPSYYPALETNSLT